MLTNSVSSFQNSSALETGLSDFDKMRLFKSYLEMKRPNMRLDRDLETFSNNDFRTNSVRFFNSAFK